MKKKMSFRHALSVHFRAAKALHGVSRRFFPAATLYTVVGAILPYVTVFFSAQILKELALLRRPDVLRNWVIAGVLCTGLCAVAKAVLFQRTETMLDDLYGRKETLFCRKFFSMDYADVDKQETRDLRAQIAQNENWSSFGLMQVPEIYERTLKSLIGILSGIALTVTLFTSPVPESAGKLTALNNPLFILILAGVMILISILAGRLEEKATSYWSCVAEEATLSNRVFSFFGFIGEHKGRGADIRMYNQQNLVTFYWNGDSAFGATGKIGKLALGPIGGYSALGTGVVALITGFVYVFTCLKAWGGAFDVGSVTQYVGAATAMADSIFKLTAQLGNLKTNAGYLDATFRFLDIPNSMYQGSLTTEKRADRQYEVEFRNVSFRYPGRVDWALKNVSMKFKVGKRLAIVGENGSGKTTFIKLLCRLYDPQEGEILLNGIDIRKYNYQDYMQIFSVVFQDFQLFACRVGENVALSPQFDSERVRRALDHSGFQRPLPRGVDTQLLREFDDDGLMLSGGESQKVAVARAFYKDCPFVILDEPSANLDPVAEYQLNRAMLEAARDKTVIFISHRLSTTVQADKIYVMEQGRIIESGSHSELMAADGIYAYMFRLQAEKYKNAKSE